MKRADLLIAAALIALFAFAACKRNPGPDIIVGSKKFTESVIIGEMGRQLIDHAGYSAQHRKQLGGTRVLWEALLTGDIDCYPEYTGTLIHEIFADEAIEDLEALRAALKARHLIMSEPLGFNNTYALGMPEERAQALGIEKISDLVWHPECTFGFTNEFLDRSDGWPMLKQRYHLPQRNVRGLDHDLAYKALTSGQIDLMDLYSTDAEITRYGLAVLADDRGVFPRYDAVLLMREQLRTGAPQAAKALQQLQGAINAKSMIALNAEAKIDGIPEGTVAKRFLAERLGIRTVHQQPSWIQEIWRHTKEHLQLVLISLTAAILIGIPLGMLAAKYATSAQPILIAVGIIQTIPSLALLVLMIPLLGIGGPPAIVALFLYSLLPIVRNTYTGLVSIPRSLRESADAIGLPPRVKLLRIELPLAARSILAGIKTSAVINVGTATLGALIGAGGYGQPILTGIRLDDMSLILQGALPAALLALLVQTLFDGVERLMMPRGLRLT